MRKRGDATSVDDTAERVWFDSVLLHVVLRNGRELRAPIEAFPRLRDATPQDRDEWRLIADGEGIHWPTLDEDISVAGLLRTS